MSTASQRDHLVRQIIKETNDAVFRIACSGEQNSYLLKHDYQYKTAWRLEKLKRPDFDICLYLVPRENKFYMSYHHKDTGYSLGDYVEVQIRDFFENRNLYERTGWTDDELQHIASSLQAILPDRDRRPLDD